MSRLLNNSIPLQMNIENELKSALEEQERNNKINALKESEDIEDYDIEVPDDVVTEEDTQATEDDVNAVEVNEAPEDDADLALAWVLDSLKNNKFELADFLAEFSNVVGLDVFSKFVNDFRKKNNLDEGAFSELDIKRQEDKDNTGKNYKKRPVEFSKDELDKLRREPNMKHLQSIADKYGVLPSEVQDAAGLSDEDLGLVPEDD